MHGALHEVYGWDVTAGALVKLVQADRSGHVREVSEHGSSPTVMARSSLPLHDSIAYPSLPHRISETSLSRNRRLSPGHRSVKDWLWLVSGVLELGYQA